MRKIYIVLAILPIGNNVREWKDYSEKDWLQSILLMSERMLKYFITYINRLQINDRI